MKIIRKIVCVVTVLEVHGVILTDTTNNVNVQDESKQPPSYQPPSYLDAILDDVVVERAEHSVERSLIVTSSS
jgi:hypothetical protein